MTNENVNPQSARSATPDQQESTFIPPSQTIEVPATSFHAPQVDYVWEGRLRPVKSVRLRELVLSKRISILGREQTADAVIGHNSVSRHHARILRDGNEFIIEDLNSTYGSFVDGVPVTRCRLHDGDELRFGQVGYYFHRDTVPDQTGGSQDPKVSITGKRDEHMTVTFWGTRGSIPTPGRMTEKAGGNTTCLEVRYQDHVIVFDAGTGIRSLSDNLMSELAGKPLSASILFTHVHWDHIQGFPFFTPAYLPSNEFTIYGNLRSGQSLKDVLSGQMQDTYFPVPLSAMQSKLQFEPANSPFEIGPIKITTIELPHPGGALAYRLETPESTFILATDCELDQIIRNKSEVAENLETQREFDPRFLDFFRGADLIIIDCQYTDAIYPTRVGWGHNSVAAVVDFALQVQPKAVALTHHDPQSTDADIASIVRDAVRRVKDAAENPPLVFAAREGMTYKVTEPLRPRALVKI